MTCNKLFCYGKPKMYEKNNDWSRAKGFYCSSLVAAAYMYSGIMKIEHCSGKYRPGFFSVDKPNSTLSLNDDFELGGELVLDFTSSI